MRGPSKATGTTSQKTSSGPTPRPTTASNQQPCWQQAADERAQPEHAWGAQSSPTTLHCTGEIGGTQPQSLHRGASASHATAPAHASTKQQCSKSGAGRRTPPPCRSSPLIGDTPPQTHTNTQHTTTPHTRPTPQQHQQHPPLQPGRTAPQGASSSNEVPTNNLHALLRQLQVIREAAAALPGGDMMASMADVAAQLVLTTLKPPREG